MPVASHCCLARTLGAGAARLLAGFLRLGQRRLDLFKAQMELVEIELLKTAVQAALDGLDNGLQALNFGLEDLECVKNAAWSRTSACRALTSPGRSALMPKVAVNLHANIPSSGDLPARPAGVRHARGASPDPSSRVPSCATLRHITPC